jgi:hypothetical protein
MSVIPALGRLRQEDPEFKVSGLQIEILSQKKKKKNWRHGSSGSELAYAKSTGN